MFERLIKLVRQEKISLFIGAGFSIEASAPSVRQLKELILSEFDNDEQRKAHANDGLDELTEFFVEEVCGGSRNDLMALMKKAFEFTPACMDDHRMLAAIPHFHNIFTTNYDTLLEDSLPSNEKNIVRTDKDCAYITNPTTIFKVHGDFTDPDSVVLTKNDYAKFLKNRPNPQMWKLVDNEFLTKHILFIGYSLEDDNILEIIKTISKSINKNQKQMFLIAPGIKEAKKTQLKKMKVQYFDAYASDFLKELATALNENISDDFRHKWISAETYTRFCHLHKYEPTVSIPAEGDNQIKEVNPLPGEQLEHKIQMTISSAFKEKMDNLDFEKNGECIDNPIYKDVPCMRLTGADLLKCTHFVNDVVFSKDIKEIIIGPVQQEFNITVRIPSANLFELINAKCYRLNNQRLLIYADCHIFMLSITVTINGEDSKTVTFRFDFKKTYKDSNEAIKWIDLPIAFFSGEDVIIKELSSTPFKFGQSEELPDNNFDKYKQYYQDVKDIELLSGKKFVTYYECTENRYNYARFVASYLKHEYVQVQCNHQDGLNFSTTDVEYGDFNNQVKVNETVTIVSTETNPRKFAVNDREFTIPYTHHVYNSCEVKGIAPNERGKIKIDFHYPQPNYLVLFSNKPASVEYPEMKPLNEIITSKNR